MIFNRYTINQELIFASVEELLIVKFKSSKFVRLFPLKKK